MFSERGGIISPTILVLHVGEKPIFYDGRFGFFSPLYFVVENSASLLALFPIFQPIGLQLRAVNELFFLIPFVE